MIFVWKKTLILILTIIIVSNIALAITSNDIFSRIKNLGTSDSEFCINNSLVTVQINKLNFRFNEVCGKVNSYSLQINTSCLIEERYVNYTTMLTGNLTNVTKEILWYENVTRECYVNTSTIPVGERCYKISGDITNELCSRFDTGHKIDWIPTIEILGTNYTRTDWAWWNSSTILFHFSLNEIRGDTSKNSIASPFINLTDTSGNVSKPVPGIIVTAFHFNKTFKDDLNTSVSNGSYSFDIRYDNFTINLWVNRSSSGVGDERIIVQRNHYGNNAAYPFDIAWESTTNKFVSFWYDTSAGTGTYSKDTVLNNTWYMITIVQNATNRSMFINGVFSNSTTTNPSLTTKNNQGFWIAQYGNGGDPIQHLNGSVDEITLFNISLSVLDVEALYANESIGCGFDNDSWCQHQTINFIDNRTNTTAITSINHLLNWSAHTGLDSYVFSYQIIQNVSAWSDDLESNIISVKLT